MKAWRLLADVGGTNVRFARADASAKLYDICAWPVVEHQNFSGALAHYIARFEDCDACTSAVLAGAGPVSAERISLTNNDWFIDTADVVRAIGQRVPTRLMNDLEAVALALPFLTDNHLQWIGTPRQRAGQNLPMLALNVGTGFGAASVIRTRGEWLPCASEAGHMSLGASNAEQLAIVKKIIHQTASLEDVLSGHGLTRLYEAIVGSSAGRVRLEPQQIMSRLNCDSAAAKVVALVTTFLGRAAGDVLLATGAWGGVFLCGSVAQSWAEAGDFTDFRAAFEAHGKMTARLRETPTALIQHPWPAFVGLARAAT